MKSTSGVMFVLLISVLTIFTSCSDKQNIITDESLIDDGDLTLRSSSQVNVTVNGTTHEVINFHDRYCNLLCDTIDAVRPYEDSARLANSIWDGIVSQAASDFNMTENDIVAEFSDINITSSNFVNIGDWAYDSLSTLQQVFIDSLMVVYIDNENATDSVLLAELDEFKQEWLNSKMDSFEVVFTVDVAKSSFVYWKNNYDSCILGQDGLNGTDNQVTLRGPDPDWKAGAKLAGGDVVGGLWGTFGGPAGWLLGGVGGTLGASVNLLIEECWDGC